MSIASTVCRWISMCRPRVRTSCTCSSGSLGFTVTTSQSGSASLAIMCGFAVAAPAAVLCACATPKASNAATAEPVNPNRIARHTLRTILTPAILSGSPTPEPGQAGKQADGLLSTTQNAFHANAKWYEEAVSASDNFLYERQKGAASAPRLCWLAALAAQGC